MFGTFRMNKGTFFSVIFLLFAVGVFCCGELAAQQTTKPAKAFPWEGKIELSPEELAFIKKHPVITVAVDRLLPPLEFHDRDGKETGLSVDYLNELAKRFGVRFEIKSFPSRNKAFDAVKTGRVDMFASITHDGADGDLIYTRPYISLPIVVYTKKGEPYVHDLADLEGKSVAVIRGSDYVDTLHSRHRSIELVFMLNSSEALKKLSSSDVYAFLGDMLTTGWVITEEGYSDIQISGGTDYKFEICMATRRNLSVLRDILQKGLDSITPQEAQSIQSRWMKIEYKQQTDRNALWMLFGVCIFMAMLFVIWNHRLRREAIKRQKITDELRESEVYLQSIFDTMHSGVMLIDPQTFKIEQVNDYACGIIGLPRDEIVGKICNDFICPTERGGCPALASADGRLELTEGSLINGKGKLIPILRSVVRIKHRGKDVFLETFTDMTAIKNAEMQIQADEDKYRSLFEMTRDATVVMRRTEFLDCNDAAVALFGCESKEEILQRKPTNFSAPYQAGGRETGELVSELYDEASTGRMPSMEWQFVRKDGSSFTGEILVSPAIVGGTPAIQVSIRDISVRKAMEVERTIFQQAISNAPVSVMITDPKGNIEYVNPFFTRTSGYELHEILGKNPRILQSGKTQREVYNEMWDTVAKGKTWSGYFYNKARDGREFHEYAHISPIMDADGKVLHYVAVKQDVTCEEELRKKIEYLSRFPSENPNPVFRISVEGILLYTNNAGKEFMGHWDTSAEQEVPEEFKKIVTEVFESRQVKQVVMSVDGKYYSISFAPIESERYVNAYGQDISELKRISDERDRLFNNSVDMLCIAGFDGCFKQVNPAWTKVLGWSAEELCSRPWLDFVHPDDLENTRIQGEKLLRSEMVNNFENRYMCKDGTYKWISWNSFALPEESLIFAVARDVTQSKQNLELLEESQRRLSLAIDGAGLGLWDWNIQTGTNYINGKWAEMLGYETEDIIPSFDDTAKFLHPDDREKMHELLNAHLFGKTDYYRCRFRMKTKSGDYKWLLSIGRVMEYDKDGNPLRMLGIHQDIDEQKKNEDALIEARKNAEEANHAKSLFLANMSHEIRTPMNAILGYTQLMQRDSDLTDVQHKYLEIINHSGTHLLSLINDILEMSKIEAGRTRVNSVIFDFLSMLEDIEMMFHVRTSPQNVLLRTIIKGNVPKYIKSDESKIRQILINLIGNAVKFTSSGHIFITVDCELSEKESEVGEVRCIKFKIDIEDTGCGISGSEMPRIFEAFEQTRTAAERGGTGLGLPISREYARMLGGDITVKSEPGLGSTFTLTFTAQYVEEPAASAIEATITHVTGLANGRDSTSVLVVDDKDTNRTVLVELLTRVGFFVRHVSNGLEALQIVKEWQPDVILMDRRMPVMDGYEAMRKIKDSPQGKNIPILIVTASALEENRADALGYGADGFVRKPYNETEIFDAIRRVTGVEYIYETGESDYDMGAYRPSSEDLAKLPEKLLGDLRHALQDGDIEHIQRLIGQVKEEDRNLGGYLFALAERYEYEKLQRILSANDNGSEKK